jgi:hypothetical protein
MDSIEATGQVLICVCPSIGKANNTTGWNTNRTLGSHGYGCCGSP